MRATHRSVIAKQRSKSRDGVGREESFPRATKISVFPMNAVTDMIMFSNRMYVKISCIPLVKTIEHRISSNDLACTTAPL